MSGSDSSASLKDYLAARAHSGYSRGVVTLLVFFAVAVGIGAVAAGLAALKYYLRRHRKAGEAVASGLAAYQQTFQPNAMHAHEETRAQQQRHSSVIQTDEHSGGQTF